MGVDTAEHTGQMNTKLHKDNSYKGNVNVSQIQFKCELILPG